MKIHNWTLTDIQTDIYGSTEAIRRDGAGVSALLTWDSKMTTVNAILGGVSDLVRQKMKSDNIYTAFVDRIEVSLIIRRQKYCTKGSEVD